MLCLICSKVYRMFTKLRTRHTVHILQGVVTFVLLAYLCSVYIGGIFTTKEKQSRKRINDDVRRTLLPPLTLPNIEDLEQQQDVREVDTKEDTDIDINIYRRNDTTPEKTEKLAFLPNYKAPCWKEYSEILTPDVKLQCLPYFHVVGVSQCGTKELFDRMTQHPLISSNIKPGNHWFTRLRFEGYPYLSDYLQYYYRAIEIDVERIKRDDGYHNAIFGDFSPSTIWDNHALKYEATTRNMSDPSYTHADVIKHLNPNARIIVILCDPVERLYADYRETAKDMKEEPDIDVFHTFVNKSIDKFNNCLVNNTFLNCVYFGRPLLSYYISKLARIQVGLYRTHLENYMKIFPKHQILITEKDKLLKEPAAVLDKIFRFLDVGNITDPIVWKHITSTDNEPPKPHDDMKPETRNIIRDFYKPFNDQLTKLLGPDYDYNKRTNLKT